MRVLRYYSQPNVDSFDVQKKLKKIQKFSQIVKNVQVEDCFNVEIRDQLSTIETEKLKWILSDSARENKFSVEENSSLYSFSNDQLLIEIGPRLNFSTPFSSNAISLCNSIGLFSINRIEKSVRYLIRVMVNFDEIEEKLQHFRLQISDALIDRMTECSYTCGLVNFNHGVKSESWHVIDVIHEGRIALQKINEKLGLSFDEWDVNFYTDLFCNKLKRNPTNVEIFDLAQSNSEHSRHWFFKGDLNIDGVNIPTTLFEMIEDTQNFSNNNNVIKFADNSSAVRGFTVKKIVPKRLGEPSEFETRSVKSHLIFTAETHNFPTAVSPFSGAATGTGGRIRDIQAVGRGGNTIAGIVGYAVGNLLIPGYELPWENRDVDYPRTFAKPLNILIEASNGCSDYGNKFGEPVISGFTRSFGMNIRNQRKEYIKPILFSGGMGTVDDDYVVKQKPKKGMKVIKIGGPAYRIGVGGGSASSAQIQGDNSEYLDFNAVQRGDPEMEQKLNRFVRCCIECPEDKNPILSIHDQGAGGNGNVLKELVEPEGAVIFSRAFELGDSSINLLELWGAEYQENNAILCNSDSETISLLQKISRRERCPLNIVGAVTGNGRVILTDDKIDYETFMKQTLVNTNSIYPINLDLQLVLGKVPRKKFHLTNELLILDAVQLPPNLSLWEALCRVLRHPTVGSKRFLTNKVDRSVTGLVARQQCVGPLHTPVSDVSVTAISYFDECGIATSIGEQPIKSLINPAAGARMSVAEAISNLVFAKISSLKDVKCSGNWMWPAKLPGEGVHLYNSCVAMCSLMKSLNIAVDGGKDSLSMATRLENNEIVKSPGTLVISAYVPCPDVRKTVTPDIKSSWYGLEGYLLHVDVSCGRSRLGGSILNQCFCELGQPVPDIDSPDILKLAFNITQKLINENKVFSGHDISDGGLITCLIEMAISGITGLRIRFSPEYVCGRTIMEILFAEECGWVLECAKNDVNYIVECFTKERVKCSVIGFTGMIGMNSKVTIHCGIESVLDVDLYSLFSLWEETSYQIEKEQMNPVCAEQEFTSFRKRKAPCYQYKLPFNFPSFVITSSIKVAIIREEGINGDREMIAALYAAGFEVWDITTQDLLDKKVTVDLFRGLIFPGGFSYADVFGAAKGWAATLLLNKKLYEQFSSFYHRNDTFSFGVCNGCQLMSLIGWIDHSVDQKSKTNLTPQVTLRTNLSGRFESRFSTVKIYKSPAIMLQNMENSVLGVWVAHGEGRFVFSSREVEKYLNENNCIPIRYVNDENEFTEEYPFNPNGSPGGIAGICSIDGRHLALMPHPERCIKFWQWPYIPVQWEKENTGNIFSPWFQIFLNAYKWCDENIYS